ncbi:MAG TPA: restriction endonuclease subunit S [Bacteroidales bacterium]|nr:restriction endonuclease subunit S [Bacteroidales bacterium]
MNDRTMENIKKEKKHSLPQGWKIKKLSEIGNVFNGNSINAKIKKEKYLGLDNGLPYIGTKDIGFDSIIDYENGVKIPLTEKELFKIAPKNTPLICVEGGSAGRKIGFTNQDVCFGNKLFALVPNKSVNSRFLFYYYFSSSFQIHFSNEMTGIIGGVSMSKFKSIEIPLPPLPEQQRIVAILDETFSAIDKAKANAEQNLKNAKELFESYLQGVFEKQGDGWEVKCLDELGAITSSKRIYKSEYVKDGVPFYRTKEIKELSNGKPITLELFISKDRYEQIKKSFGVPQIGDLLMSAVGTIGEIMVIENEDEFYFKDGNIVWFKDFQRLDTNYLKYALTAFVEKIKSLAIGAAYSALTIEKLNKYEITFPKTKEEQQTIVRQLDTLRIETQKLESIYQKKILLLEELKKSILQKAFSGELN